MITSLIPYKNLIFGILAVLLLVGLYFAFSGKGKDKPKEDEASACPSSFTIHPLGGFTGDALSMTFSKQADKYFSQSSGGYLGYGIQLAPKEIKKEVFLAACKSFQQQSGTPQ